MRGRVLSGSLLTALALIVVGATPCGNLGPSARSFAAGALVIPMDNCYQKRDTTTPAQTSGCNASSDDGVFRAYGLVYFLLKHGVTVYWAIDPAKADVTGVDVTVPAPASGAAAQRVAWDGTTSDVAGTSSGVRYIGGPFLVDAQDADRVVAMLTSAADPLHADFARFQQEAVVDLHKVRVAFTANQVRPLTGPPPKLAILNVTPPSSKKTSVNVMYQYAVAAGLSWPCRGDGDCAGGLGPGCSKSVVLAYLANPAGDPKIPQSCDGSGLCAPNFNQGSGTANDIYEVLCDDDFIPPGAGTTYADTQLAKGSYKLLWVPHWDTGAVVPTGSTDPGAVPPLPAATAQDKLAWQLRSIASYVNAGNNLFVECLGIQAMEGVTGQTNVNGPLYGIPAARFQTTSGMKKWNGSGTLSPFLAPEHPNMQVGDFAYSVVTGAITTYHPDNSASPTSTYLGGVKRLVTELNGTTPWDVSSTIQVLGSDSAPRGNVAYLGGHNYSPTSDAWPHTTADQATKGQTAGTRIVLNTLFNLGFGCADPDPNDPSSRCTTGSFGACAQGHLRCASGGGLQCVPDASPTTEVCDGVDNDCNGLVDEGGVCAPAPVCTEGATRSCYDGSGTPRGACRAGTQTCAGGLWGACAGQVLPTPEACNGKDDDCNGQVDDGNLCGAGSSCVAGVCVPTSCNGETSRCPTGFDCDSATATCKPQPCPTTACTAGKVCQAGQCVDPCASVSCGPGATCSGGQCVGGGCALTGCPSGQVCLSGTCAADPCASASCPVGTFCRLGDCVRSCAYVECAAGSTCGVDGFCEPSCSPACAAGQVCSNGACQADACAGVTCGRNQECRGGACVDQACSHVTCPQGSCVAGQCVGGVTTSEQRAVAPAPSGGGCGSGGAGGVGSIALALLALAYRRSPSGPRQALLAGARLRRRPARVPVAVALVAAGAFLAAGCSKGTAGTSCQAGLTACGAACVDLATSAESCGACGHACAAGFTCTGGSCAYPTGNPHLAAIEPAAVGLGSSPTLRLTGDGFQTGATARITGAGLSRDGVALTVESATSATMPALDLTTATLGTAQVRVLNPGRLVSNAVTLSVVGQLALTGVAPAGARQDQTTAVDLVLTGVGFAPNVTAALGRNGATVPLPVTYVDAGTLKVVGLAPGSLAVGVYDVTVTVPGGATSAPARFSITEGAPVVSAVTPTCVVVSPTFAGSVTGSWLYPSSVVRVSGNSIVDSPLATSCLTGTDAIGRCAGGELRVTADLTGIPAGTYTVSVVNPGTPSPLRSSAQPIQVKPSCP